jgi:hypothetical protein
MQRLKLMITAEEAQNPDNAEKAAQIFRWIDYRQVGLTRIHPFPPFTKVKVC